MNVTIATTIRVTIQFLKVNSLKNEKCFGLSWINRQNKISLKKKEVMNCIKCNCAYTYEISGFWICPECNHEWTMEEAQSEEKIYEDSNGNILIDGDCVVVIKDLKIMGSSSVIKQRTKVKNIKLVDNDHDINCKIDGIGQCSIKTMFVKKS